MKKLKTFYLCYLIGKSHFEEDSTQNNLVFQPIIRYFKVNLIINANDYILSWKFKGLLAETVKPPNTSDNNLTLTISYYYAAKIKVKVTGSCLTQSKISYNHRDIVNIYIVYELGASGSNNSHPTLKYCLFGTATLTRNADFDKYEYCRYGYSRSGFFCSY